MRTVIQLRQTFLRRGDALIVAAPAAGSGGVAEEDITVTYRHEGSRAPDIMWCVFLAPCSFDSVVALTRRPWCFSGVSTRPAFSGLTMLSEWLQSAPA